MPKKNILIKSFFFLSLLLFLNSCSPKNEKQSLQGEVFGSTYAIQYFGTENFQTEIDSIFAEINQSVSTYTEDSQISKWNAGNDSLKLSKDFIDMASVAYEVYEKSDGFYDPTVKTLVEGWGFGHGKPSNELTDAQVQELLKNVGFNKLRFTIDEARIYKENKNIQLDFNSIAPGFTADRIAEFLSKKGVKNYLIDIGGELNTHGKNTEKDTFWNVGIQNPLEPNSIDSYASKELHNQSLATSGNYRKIKTDSVGRSIVHTINPKTGYTVPSNLLSVTIVVESAALADAYATASMAMGLERAEAFLIENKIPAFLIYEENKELKTKKLNGF